MAEGGHAWSTRSFLLTDIVGSVSAWERDAGRMARAVARHDELVRSAVQAAKGELVRSKGEGDSTFSVFAHPADAVAAAGDIQRVLAAEPWPTDVPVSVRAGVHTGDAEPRDGDWCGPAVNRAARLRALAGGGQTLVSGSPVVHEAKEPARAGMAGTLCVRPPSGVARTIDIRTGEAESLRCSDGRAGAASMTSRTGHWRWVCDGSCSCS